MAHNAPTLNPEYNYLLKAWAEQGFPSEPECEDCGCDLTGSHVYETSTSWLCTSCWHLGGHDLPVDDDYDGYGSRERVRSHEREDFHADG